MTVLDRIGKWIAGAMYRFYIKHPGQPTLTGYARDAARAEFCQAWPWSHGKGAIDVSRLARSALRFARGH